jgi:hypothetical protein
MPSSVSREDAEGKAAASESVVDATDEVLRYACANNRKTSNGWATCSLSGDKHCGRCGLVGVGFPHLVIFVPVTNDFAVLLQKLSDRALAHP